DAAKACGLACVQMSMACANLPEMPDQIPAELPERIRREASARGIAIASVTGTFNMSHPDVEYRRTGCGGYGSWPRHARRWALPQFMCALARVTRTTCGGIIRTMTRRSRGGIWPLVCARRPDRKS